VQFCGTITVKWGFSGKKSGSLEELLWKILDSRTKFLGAIMTLDLSSPAESHITFFQNNTRTIHILQIEMVTQYA
jgi:hypothetical protein